MTNKTGAYIVSWDFSRGHDSGVLIVGFQRDEKVSVVNAFQGDEAYEIYKKLSGVKKTEE